MKRILSLVLVFLMVLSLAACGAQKTEPAPATTQTPAATQPAGSANTPSAPASSAAPAAPAETPAPKDEPFDIVDSVGRTVHFEKTADTCATAAIQGGAFMTMCALFGDKVTDHLVAWDGGMASWTDWTEVFFKAMPQLADVKNVGTFNVDKLDVEALLAIKPDVMICPIYYYNLEGMHDKLIPTIEQAGIPVVVVDYRRDELDAHLHCMEIIGKIFGEETRAKQLADFYKEQVDLVFNKTDKLKENVKDPPVFYIEFAWKGASDQGLSYSNKSQWGNILTSIGASTLYADADTDYPTVDPEYILSSDPDGLILLGGWWGNEGQMPLGFMSNGTMVDEVMAQYCARPGWDQLKAVKNGQVYTLCNSLTHDIFSFCSFQQMAKIVYPEEFKDLDPNASLKAFFDEFMPVDYSGLWYHQMNVADSPAPDAKDLSFDIVDSVGRTVHFDKPAVTCCTGYQGGSFFTMCAFFGDKVVDHIVSWDGLLTNWPGFYEKFCEVMPGLKDIPVVGNFQPDKLDVEALIASDPDVVIIPIYYFNLDGIHDKVVPQLEAAGIPCVCTNYRRDELPEHLHCMEILGKIFGQEERAKKLADFYESSVTLVYDRVDKLMGADKEQPSFFVEFGNKGAGSQGLSYSNASQWGNILTSVGATTIYADSPDLYPTVDPEYVLASDPDNILILGEQWSNPSGSVSLGLDITEDVIQKTLEEYAARPGWSALSAVKGKNVYAICNGLTHDIFSFYCFQEIAKVVWPDDFSDLDPDRTLADFFHEFMPIELEGVWFYKLQ